ncbi:hypothetical protein DAEQUDRAFT_732558 [Daedalea quercina L-15889]|uniref:Uncharacterized protein n=1 Tax=Daedalea quercina L-15889 TaxID=1314783 RepID=A0A165LJ82_9APHY|nr:hypothetical protein DAEQUDRAFT_732558 [Daedalea quercina L-15889]
MGFDYYSRPRNLTQISSLSETMGLHKSDPEFAEFTDALRCLARDVLDTNRSLTEQDPGEWEKFYEEALELVPQYIRKYEDCWPIEAYMRQYLSRGKYNNNGSLKKGSAGARAVSIRGGRPNQEREPEVERPHSRPGMRSRKGPDQRKSEVFSPACAASGTISGNTSRSCRQVSPPCMTAIPPATTTASKALPGTSPFKVCEETVRAFLRALEPSMEELTTQFIEAGLVNGQCLVAFAGMPRWEKEKFLRDDLALKSFQERVISLGLAELRE